MMDETRLVVFRGWRIMLPILTVCMMPGCIGADTRHPWAWIATGAFMVISGLLWLRRLPPAVMWLLMLVANVAGAIDSVQGERFALAVLCGAVACACVWWAWGARNDPSEHVVARHVAEGGEG